jgi:hypothetical protein
MWAPLVAFGGWAAVSILACSSLLDVIVFSCSAKCRIQVIDRSQAGQTQGNCAKPIEHRTPHQTLRISLISAA